MVLAIARETGWTEANILSMPVARVLIYWHAIAASAGTCWCVRPQSEHDIERQLEAMQV